MTVVGIISDTHGLLRPEAIEALRGVALILHAGDVGAPEILAELRLIAPVIAVRGNVDRGPWASGLPPNEVIEIEGIAIYMSNLYFLAAQAGGGSGLALFAPVLLIFGVFYFLLILPQQRRQKKWQQMLSELKTGDKVVTSGGLKGTIFSIKEDSVTLRVPPDNLKMEVSRGSIVTVTSAEETVSK